MTSALTGKFSAWAGQSPTNRAVTNGIAAGLAVSLAIGAVVLAIRSLPGLALGYPLALLPLLAAGPLAVREGKRSTAQAVIAGLAAGITSALATVAVLSAAVVWLGETRWALMGPSATIPWITLPRPAVVPGMGWPHQLILFLQPPLAVLLALIWASTAAAHASSPTGRVRSFISGAQASVETKLLYAFAVLAILTIAVAWVGFSALEDGHLRGHRFQLGADWATHVGELSSYLEETGRLVPISDAPVEPSSDQALAVLNREREQLIRHLRSTERHANIWALPTVVSAVATRHAAAVDAADQALREHAEITATILSGADSPSLREQLRLAELRGHQALMRLDGAIVQDLKQELDAVDLDHHANLVGIMALLALVIALTGLISRAVATAITEPITAMNRHLSRMARGDFRGRLNVSNRDELGGLATELNRVSGELGRLYEVERQQREGSEARYQALFQGVADAILVADAEGRLLDANEAAFELLGTTPDELIGRSVSTLLAAPTVGARPDLAGLEHWHGQFFLKAADGRWLPVESRATSVHDGDQVVHVALVRDIADRMEKDAELREINQKLSQALEDLQHAQHRVIQQERLSALGQMASGIAHDMNNSLAPVVGFSELLLAAPDPSESPETLRKYLELIHTAAQDAAAVVNRLREYYRPAGEESVSEAINLNSLIDTVVSLTQPKWKGEALARGGPIEVVTDYGDPLMIAGNASSLREALTNIVLNACDAMPEGGTLTLAAAQRGDDAIIRISDTGLGMSDEARQRCFEPFYTTKGKRGTGLGLEMVWGVIQRHQGRIDVDSKLGEGTTFTIQLPVGDVPEQLQRPEPVAEARRSNELQILVVDDEPSVVKMVGEMLSAFGHSAVCTSNAATALQMVQEQYFDVVITDRSMPEINGDQLAKSVRRISPETRVILLTGFGDLLNAVGEKPEGVDIVLGKPLSMRELNEAVSNLAGLAIAA